MSDAMPTFCKDCNHYCSMQGTGEPARCKRPRKPIYDLVEGYKRDPIYHCKTERTFIQYADGSQSCGPDALLFEPKPCKHSNRNKYGFCEVCGWSPYPNAKAAANSAYFSEPE